MASIFDKSIFKPENSAIAGIATVGLVAAIYELDVGQVSQAAASDANHPALASAKKKAGYTSFIAVAGLTLITRDRNVGVLGFLSIIGMEIHFRHAIMSDPATGRIQAPSAAIYTPAENVVPITSQATDAMAAGF
jgi:hypothetical protein